MRRRVKIILATVAGLVLLTIVGVLISYRLGALDWFVERQLRAQLTEMNIRLDLKRAHIGLAPGTVEVEGMSLYPGQDQIPFVSVDKAIIKFDITSLMAQTAEVKSVELVRPIINIRFDETGRSNLDAIKWPDTPKEAARPTSQITYQMATLAIDNGQLNYGDAVRKIDGTVDSVKFAFAPKGEKQADGSAAAYRFDAEFSNSKLVYEGREVTGINAKVGADLTRDGAKVDTLSLESPLGTTTAKGTITDWSDPGYNFEIATTAALQPIGAVADPNMGLTGTAMLNGTLTGKGANYKFEGDIKGDDLYVAGVRIADLSAAGQLQGERLDYAWVGELMASRLVGADFDVSGLRFKGGLRGNENGPTAVDVGSLTAARVSGDGFAASGISFNGTVDPAARSASGDVGMTSVALRTVRVGSIRARITADTEVVNVERFTAAVYGGSVTGSARAQLADGGTSSLAAEFRGVDVDQALNASSADAPRVNGRASGRVNLSWPGANVQAATGTVRATIDGSLPGEEGQEAIPLSGELALTAQPGRFRIDTAEFTSGDTRVTATGTVGWDRRSDVTVTAEAADGKRLLDLASAANPDVAEAIRKSGIALNGAFRFDGRVTGPIKNPSLVGHVDIGGVASNEEPLGSFVADIRREAGVLSIEGAKLRRDDGGEIAFDVSIPSRDADSQIVKAQITRYPLRALARAAGLGEMPIVEKIGGGSASGSVDLQIPAQGNKLRLAMGRVDLAVEGGNVNGEPIQELRVAADLRPGEIAVSDLRFVTARGAVTGTASIDRTGEELPYKAQFEAKNADLNFLAAASSTEGKPPPNVTGTLNGTLAIEGVYGGDITNLTANVTGSNVAVNDEQVGNPQLTVDTGTDASGEQIANVKLAADLRGERRELAGVIFIKKEDYPFRFAASLAQTDVVKYVPDPPEGVSTRITGDLTVTGFLGDVTGPRGIADRLGVDGKFSELALAVNQGGLTYNLANNGDVAFKAENGVLRFARASFTGDQTSLTIDGDLALKPEATSNLRLAGDINLALLSSFARDAYAGGVASLEATITGTLADPRFRGTADVRNASLRVVDLPIAIQNGNGQIRFTANQALIDSFTAQAGGGRLRLEGGVLFAGLAPSRWRFGINAEAIRVTYPDDVRSVLDGDLTLQGNEQLQVLAGTVNLRRAEYTTDVELNDLLSLSEGGSSGSFGSGNGATGTSPIRLDLRVEARDSIIVRNNLADVVASASLGLTGPADAPVIDGRATVTRGTINFRNGEYQVTRGVVRFPGRLGGDITFDLQAESDIKGYNVQIGLSGTPDKPYPVLRSEPPLPETQIISLVLTGDLGGGEITTQALTQSGVGLASSLLGEAVSRSVEKRTSKLFGINRFQIDPLVGGSNPSARLTLGRQVNKNLSIIYSTNIASGQEQVIQIEYRISDRFSVVATRDERGAYGLDFRVKKRF